MVLPNYTRLCTENKKAKRFPFAFVVSLLEFMFNHSVIEQSGATSQVFLAGDTGCRALSTSGLNPGWTA
jgi:hypothetical protein